MADLLWDDFLAKAEREGCTRHSRFLIGVVDKPSTLVLEIITSSPPEAGRAVDSVQLGF